MKLSYDPQRNIGYLLLQEKTAEVETIHISEELNVDISPDGRIYGIELLNANEQLSVLAKENLIVENEATGETIEVKLP
jgi:uncharacterized protein YuzE